MGMTKWNYVIFVCATAVLINTDCDCFVCEAAVLKNTDCNTVNCYVCEAAVLKIQTATQWVVMARTGWTRGMLSYPN